VNIDIVSIAKKERSIYDQLYKELTKIISSFAKVQDIELFNRDVTKAHTISPEASKQAYTKLLEPYLSKGFNVTLHPDGKIIDSYEFSKLLDGKIAIKFLIGGAYGFEDRFLKKSDAVISLAN